MTSEISDRTVADLKRVLGTRKRKEKTSVSLSGEIIRASDIIAGKARRSAFVEKAVRAYLRRILRRADHERDLKAINSRAEITNRESDELLDLQTWPE
jgi:metal-responsive CopG/Arc/MetJ family transcriptional regulator